MDIDVSVGDISVSGNNLLTYTGATNQVMEVIASFTVQNNSSATEINL